MDLVLELQPITTDMSPTLLLLSALGIGPPGTEGDSEWEDALSFPIVRPAILHWISTLDNDQLRRAILIIMSIRGGKQFPPQLLGEARELMEQLEAAEEDIPPVLEAFLESWREEMDVGVVETLLKLLAQRTRKPVLKAEIPKQSKDVPYFLF